MIEAGRLEAIPALSVGTQVGGFRLEVPGNERREAPGFVLQIPQQCHVLQSVLNCFHVPVHHRRRRSHAQTVSDPMHL